MNKYNEYSNAELRRKVDEIKNEFEATKNNIESLCQKLEGLEKEYAVVMQELDNRKNLN